MFRRYCFTTSSTPLRCSSSSQKVFGLFGSPIGLFSRVQAPLVSTILLRNIVCTASLFLLFSKSLWTFWKPLKLFSLPRSLILHKFWNYVSKFCPFKMLSVTLLLSEKTCFNIFAIPNSDILSTFLLFFSFPIQFPNNTSQLAPLRGCLPLFKEAFEVLDLWWR